MNATVKPWKSFAEQLELLKSRGLQVDNEQAALNYLERIGYYRLSGYWYPFRLMDKSGAVGRYIRHNNFVEGSRFETAVKLYVFDKNLRLLALDALERIELSLRVDVAHILAKDDVYAHENPACFHGNFTKKSTSTGKTLFEEWQRKHKSLLNRARREPFVEHYNKKYGRLPIWVAIEVWDFGHLSKIFAGMKYEHKEVIAQKYGVKNGRTLESWLRSLNFIRNVSAHHSRLWNINMLERAQLPDDAEYWAKLNNARPFLYFCLMQKLMAVICPNSTWCIRFEELLNEFPESKSIQLEDFGLVDDWREWWGLE